jgi:hypothetical protein
MKSSIIFFIILSSIAFSNASAQLTWSMDNSPYHSYVNNFSVGVKNGNTVMYAAGYANNVLVKSTNGGETWDTVLTILGRDWLTVCCSPNNADIIYVGAPRIANTQEDIVYGVWKSMDGGEHWERLTQQPENMYITSIAVHPSNPDIVYVGCNNPEPDNAYPVLSYTTNGGEEWVNKNIGDNMFVVTDIAIASNPLYAWITTAYGKNGSTEYTGMWKTTNTGSWWDQANDGIDEQDLNFASVSVDPRNDNLLFIGMADNGIDGSRKIYQTVNGTEN